MTEKPTYETLERRVKALEKELLACTLREEGDKEPLPLLKFTLFTVNQAKTAIFWCHSSGMFFYVNDQAVEWLQYSREELMDMHVADINPEFPRDAWPAHWQEIKEKGMVRMESVHRRKNGEIYPVEIFSNYVEYEGAEYKLAFVNDISDRMKAKAALRKSEEKYRLLVENQTDLVVKVDLEGRFLFVSPSYCRMFGKTEEELLGKKFMPLAHEDDREATARAMEELLRPPYTCYLEQRAMTKNGWRWLAWSDTAVLDKNGEVTAVIGAGRDVTGDKIAVQQRKELETRLQQAQKMEAIGTLAGGIAHDFNNILGAIMGYTELAAMDLPENVPAKANLQQVLKATNRAKDVVTQILAFSRQTEQEQRPLKLGPVIKEVLKLLRASIPTTIEIRQHIDRNLGAVVADPSKIHQVLMNLCTNAAHAMQDAGGVLDVSLIETYLGPLDTDDNRGLDPGPYVKLSISDTGHGMEPEVVERIFDPYFTTKEKGVGTGLGLSVVHGIVENHGGAIRVQTALNEGTRFDVYLPRIDAVSLPKAELGQIPPMGSERILFVDDEEALVQMGKQMLERLGYEVTPMASSVEALRIFQAHPESFDLVITDQTMPNLTGHKLARGLMEIRPDIPVILCSGFGDALEEGKIKELDIRAFVMKPLIMLDLAKTIRSVLEEK